MCVCVRERETERLLLRERERGRERERWTESIFKPEGEKSVTESCFIQNVIKREQFTDSLQR